MELPDFLAHQDGEIRLAGSRVGLAHIVRAYRCGDSAEMIALHYPTVSLAHVHKVVAFFLENRSEVNDYVDRIDNELELLRQQSPAPSPAELQARLKTSQAFAKGA
jgi:uncharacterized protein (DUF433 family)